MDGRLGRPRQEGCSAPSPEVVQATPAGTSPATVCTAEIPGWLVNDHDGQAIYRGTDAGLAYEVYRATPGGHLHLLDSCFRRETGDDQHTQQLHKTPEGPPC
jgi:hypothetical protein